MRHAPCACVRHTGCLRFESAHVPLVLGAVPRRLAVEPEAALLEHARNEAGHLAAVHRGLLHAVVRLDPEVHAAHGVAVLLAPVDAEAVQDEVRRAQRARDARGAGPLRRVGESEKKDHRRCTQRDTQRGTRPQVPTLRAPTNSHPLRSSQTIPGPHACTRTHAACMHACMHQRACTHVHREDPSEEFLLGHPFGVAVRLRLRLRLRLRVGRARGGGGGGGGLALLANGGNLRGCGRGDPGGWVGRCG